MGFKESILALVGDFVDQRRNPEFKSRSDLSSAGSFEKLDRPISRNRRHSLSITVGTVSYFALYCIQILKIKKKKFCFLQLVDYCSYPLQLFPLKNVAHGQKTLIDYIVLSELYCNVFL